ncbi:MAG: hypothetical protein KI786_07850 [Mameliella sp.]|nr:hypothetical protein [Phaeodactylibacter sp.]
MRPCLPLACKTLQPTNAKPSRNVENCRLERFTSSGQSVWYGDATDLDQAQLPQAAGTYFWRAQLECFRALDQLPFQRTVSGQLILID